MTPKPVRSAPPRPSCPHIYLDEGAVADLGVQGPDVGGQVHVQEQVVLRGDPVRHRRPLWSPSPSRAGRSLTFISSSILRHEAYLDS